MARTKQFDEAAVLEKAKNLFWKQGFHATSVQDLVDYLGINRASLYATYGGKNALYEAALKSYREQNGKVVQNLCSDSCSPLESIRQLFRSIVSGSQDDPDKKGCFIVNCTTEYLPLHDTILPELVNNQKWFQAILTELLTKSRDSGELNPEYDPEDIAAYLFTMLSGLQVRSKISADTAQLHKLVDIAIDNLKS